MWHRFWADKDGQMLVEYGLLAAWLAIVSIAILTVMGRKVRDSFTTVDDRRVTSAV